MMLELAEYSSQKKSDFLRSIDISWLSEFENKSTFNDFRSTYKISDVGSNLFYEIDYENLSGINNSNLTPAEDALEIINTIVELYKSEKFNFLKTYIVPPDEPLKDSRLYFSNDKLILNFPKEFYHGFTPKEFLELKKVVVETEKIYAFLPIDEYSEQGHKLLKGEKVELVFKSENMFHEKKSQIQPVIDLVLEAARKNHYVQLMSC